MTDQHPITPPPELVQEWARYQGFESPEVLWRQIATEAARWGADQELEACCEWLRESLATPSLVECFLANRRPKPSSLKEQALAWCNDYIDPDGIIRRALEQLDD